MLRCSLDLFYFFGYREPPPFVCCLLRLEVQGFSFPLQACGAATTCFLILFFRLQNFGSLGPQNCHPHTYFRGFHSCNRAKRNRFLLTETIQYAQRNSKLNKGSDDERLCHSSMLCLTTHAHNTHLSHILSLFIIL
uniref:Uncharacterized protein n=1 Tax=Populus trichocarpa TaxID=3694 RepID=A0A3N7HJY9_POPTR